MGGGCASYARIRAFVVCLAAYCVVVAPHAAAGQTLAGADEEEATPRLLPADVGWTVDLGAGPLHAPAWDSRTAYVALRTGWLTAVDLQSGETVWSVEQPADQSPVTGEQLVVVADGALLTARRTGDGVAHWTRSFEASVAGPLFFEAGWVVAATTTGDLLALRGVDGAEVWRQPLGATPTARPSLAGEHLYVPLDDGRVVALALATEHCCGRVRLPASHRGSCHAGRCSSDQPIITCTGWRSLTATMTGTGGLAATSSALRPSTTSGSTSRGAR